MARSRCATSTKNRPFMATCYHALQGTNDIFNQIYRKPLFTDNHLKTVHRLCECHFPFSSAVLLAWLVWTQHKQEAVPTQPLNCLLVVPCICWACWTRLCSICIYMVSARMRMRRVSLPLISPMCSASPGQRQRRNRRAMASKAKVRGEGHLDDVKCSGCWILRHFWRRPNLYYLNEAGASRAWYQPTFL